MQQPSETRLHPVRPHTLAAPAMSAARTLGLGLQEWACIERVRVLLAAILAKELKGSWDLVSQVISGYN